MEKWDLYTRNRECTGREQIRGETIPEGLYHLVVHVWLKNHQGQYLICLLYTSPSPRDRQKSRMPSSA